MPEPVRQVDAGPGSTATSPHAVAPAVDPSTVAAAPLTTAITAPAVILSPIAAPPTAAPTTAITPPNAPASVAAPGEVAVAPSFDLEVVARLVEPKHTSHCGYFHYVVVMRYEVVRVVAGEYTAKDLYVAHSCPELVPTPCRDLGGARVKDFIADDVHHLRLRLGRVSGSLVDAFAKQDRTLPRYKARCVNHESPSP